MASFQGKIGWKRLTKRGNKNYRSVSFQTKALQKIPKKQQKNSRNKKIPLWLLSKPKQGGKGRGREKIKIIVPFCSNSMRNRKFQKNSKKFQKIKKIPLWHHFKPKQVGNGSERENKNYRFVSFLPDA